MNPWLICGIVWIVLIVLIVMFFMGADVRRGGNE